MLVQVNYLKIVCHGIRTHNHLVRKRTLNGWVFVYKLSGWGSNPAAVTKTSDIWLVSSKEALEIQAATECFTD